MASIAMEGDSPSTGLQVDLGKSGGIDDISKNDARGRRSGMDAVSDQDEAEFPQRHNNSTGQNVKTLHPTDDSYSKYGRPLSIIESVISEASSTGEDSDDDKARGSRMKTTTPTPKVTRDAPSPMPAPDDLDAQIQSLFETFVPEDESTKSDAPATRSIKLAQLPDLLTAFEKSTGKELLDQDLLPQVKAFADGNAEVIVQPEEVVAVIRQLQDASANARKSTGVDERQQAQQDDATSDAESTTSYSSQDGTSEDRDSEDDTLQRQTPSKSRAFVFPRSQSERAELSASSPDGYKTPSKPLHRKSTLSDPSTPNSGSKLTPGSRERPGTSSGEKEILKGKGKVRAPPSAWSRPKPQALATRHRKTSDTSGNGSSFESAEYERGNLASPSQSNSPKSLAMALSKQQMQERISSPTAFTSFESAMSQLPDSPSANPFSFPRAQSPLVDDLHDVEAQARWNALSEDLQGRRSADANMQYDDSSNNPASPGSPPKRRSLGSRRSSTASRRRGLIDENSAPGETMASLQAQVEGLQRLLIEKRHSFEQMQHETEEYISRLQEDLDSTKSDLALKKKEETLTRIRENNHLDVIAGLEADLNKANKELAAIKSQYAKLKTAHDQLVDAMERHTSRNIELRDELNRLNAQSTEHTENERTWEEGREAYRNTIKSLHDEIAELQEKLMGRDEDARVISSLQANIDALTAELEEVRSRGSSIPGRRDGTDSNSTTLSKRLGAELARSRAASTSQEDLPESSSEAGEESTDSIVVYHRRKRASTVKGKHSSHAIELTDAEAQTDAEAGPSRQEEGAPPTYDEASTEKNIVQRLHPRLDQSGGQVPTLTEASYATLVRKLGVRCVTIEEHLRHTAESVAASRDYSVEVSEQWRRLCAMAKATCSNPSHAMKRLADASWRTITTARLDGNVLRYADSTLVKSAALVIVGLVLGAVLFSGAGFTAREDPVAWHMSNALEVPWSYSTSNNDPTSPSLTFLSRLFALPASPFRGYRVPT